MSFSCLTLQTRVFLLLCVPSVCFEVDLALARLCVSPNDSIEWFAESLESPELPKFICSLGQVVL